MKPEPNEHKKALDQAIKDWRAHHRLGEDDAVLLLIELFRIHQEQWDAIRQQDLPSLEQFRGDFTKLADACRSLRQEAAALSDSVTAYAATAQGTAISRTAAWLAALAGILAGYLLGRAWQ